MVSPSKPCWHVPAGAASQGKGDMTRALASGATSWERPSGSLTAQGCAGRKPLASLLRSEGRHPNQKARTIKKNNKMDQIIRTSGHQKIPVKQPTDWIHMSNKGFLNIFKYIFLNFLKSLTKRHPNLKNGQKLGHFTKQNNQMANKHKKMCSKMHTHRRAKMKREVCPVSLGCEQLALVRCRWE